MAGPDFHIFVCTNRRPPGHPKGSCGDKNSEGVWDAFRQVVEMNGLWGKVRVTRTGCLGPCHAAPSLVVYPEGTWYKHVTIDDVPEILKSHINDGKPLERLVMDPAELG